MFFLGDFYFENLYNYFSWFFCFMEKFLSDSQRRMAQFLLAAKIDYIYVPERVGKPVKKGPCFSLPALKTYLYETDEVVLPQTASSDAMRFCFTSDGKFSSFGDKKWAAVFRCPTCSSMFFGSCSDSQCPLCHAEVCSVYALGSDGIPGWFGGGGDFLFNKDELDKKISSLPVTDGLIDKLMAVANLLSGSPQEAVLTQEKAKEFGRLSRMYPNMVEVLKYFRASLVRTKLRKSKAISFRPILLVGGPGCGKSSFARELGSIVSGKEPLRVDLGNDVASFTLAGSDMSWRKSKCGLVLQSMFGDGKSGPLRNPVVILDEMDKIPLSGAHEVEGVFYSILERETAAHFRDNYFDIPVDASGINYIATANSLSNIPSAILSRFQVFEIRDYSDSEFLDNVIPNFYEKWIEFERIDRDAVPKVLSDSIKKLVFSICGTDTRKISSAFDKVLEKTGKIDKLSGKFIAFFSDDEIRSGWRKFAGKPLLPTDPFVI